MPDYKIRLIVTGEDRGASRVMGGVADSLGRIGEFAAGGLLASGIETLIGGTARAGRNAAGSLGQMVVGAGNFEQRVDTINSLLGGTVDDAEKIGQLIYGLGLDPNLQVNANEAADTVETLARNGLGLEQVMDGAARSTVLLANATGAEFADAADIATDAMSIFGLEADQMGEAVDGITGVVTNSKFSINDYQLALAQGGAAANLAGMSFDEFNTGIAAISSSFASGSDAGTSFKTMTQRLVPSTDAASAAMDYLGLSFTNADGSMKSAAEVAGELNRVFEGQIDLYSQVGGRTAEQNGELKRLTGMYTRTQNSIKDYEAGIKGANLSDEKRAEKLAELNGQLESIHGQMEPLLAIQGETVKTTRALTEAEKVHYMQTIFGTDAMRAAAAMAGYTEEEFSALMGTIGESDAEVAAARRMDNLAGDMEVFGGIVETLKLQIGEKFQPAARSFVQSMTDVMEVSVPQLVAGAESLAGFAAPYIEQLSSTVSQALGDFTSGLAEGKLVVKVGDLIDFQSDGTKTTIDLFDLIEFSAGERGAGMKLTIEDFVNFERSPTMSKFSLEDVFSFEGGGGQLRKLTIGDFLDLEQGGFGEGIELRVGKLTFSESGETNYYGLGPIEVPVRVRSLLWDELPVIEVMGKWAAGALDGMSQTAAGWLDDKALQIQAEALEPIWGDFTHTYDVFVKALEPIWGDFTHTYDVLTEALEPIWGTYTTEYGVGAKVSSSPDWGNWTHTYNVTAKVSTAIDDFIKNNPGSQNSGGFGESSSGSSGGGGGSGSGGSSGFGSRAIGERNWGGGLVKVHRDEILAIPSGAHIFTPTEARQMAGGGAGGPNITINATVANDMDLNEMAYRLLDIIQRRN